MAERSRKDKISFKKVDIMTISDRIFEKLAKTGMTQKKFSEETGIQQSTISEWKKNHTNPTSDKIMPICKTLKVSPEWLLSGIDRAGNKRKKGEYLIIEKDTEIWTLVEQYKSLDKGSRDRILGYVEAFATLKVKEI